jgi:hypothetical protein
MQRRGCTARIIEFYTTGSLRWQERPNATRAFLLTLTTAISGVRVSPRRARANDSRFNLKLYYRTVPQSDPVENRRSMFELQKSILICESIFILFAPQALPAVNHSMIDRPIHNRVDISPHSSYDAARKQLHTSIWIACC